MKVRRIRNISIVIVLMMAICIVMTSCTQQTAVSQAPAESQIEAQVSESASTEVSAPASQAVETKKWKVLLVAKLVGIPYIDRSKSGAEEASKDLNVEVNYTGPVNATAADQVKMIEDALPQGYDAIAVMANDQAAFTPILTKAREMGIKTIDWDSAVDPSVVDYSLAPVSIEDYGKEYVEQLVKYMGTSGEYAIITGGLNATSLNQWLDAAEAHAKANYPDLKLVTSRVPTDEKADVAYQKTLELIAAYPDLKGIITTGSPCLAAAGQAIKEKGLKDKIALVGATTPNSVKDLIESGDVKSAIMWDPAQGGYAAVYVMKCMLDGTPITDGMVVDKVGTFQVDGKNIVFGSPTVWDSSNIDSAAF